MSGERRSSAWPRFLRLLRAGLLGILPLGWIAIPAALAAGEIVFDDVSAVAGLRFVHEHGGSGEKYMVETMGSGLCFLDYDLDGDADLYLVQGAPLPGFPAGGSYRNALYRNLGVGDDGVSRFEDVTDRAGVGDPGWGMGCTAGDVDGDGDLDLFVTNWGPDVLYRNDGDGTFSDVTGTAGLGDARWSASAAFGDGDGDGDLDLYVTHYVDFTLENHHPCAALIEGMSSYCHPNAYSPVPDSYFRNRGDGTFVPDDAALGPVPPANGLGVVWSDVDGDGAPDIYVANDATPNFLLMNRGDGTFRDRALVQGVAVNGDGLPEAGMGVEAADLDGDGRPDIFLTHLAMETNTLYRNLGGGRFVDWSIPSGVAQASLRFVGFGAVALDFDLDGDLDLLVANGHILDDVEENHWTNVTYAEPMHLLENDGRGRFREVAGRHGSALGQFVVGRGLAVADVDVDGDLDAAVSASRGPARLLQPRGATGAWLELDLRQAGPNPFAVGSALSVESGGRTQAREVRTASSYLSQNDLTVHVGLGEDAPVRVEVRWPGGARERFDGLAPRARYSIRAHAAPGGDSRRTVPLAEAAPAAGSGR